MLKDFYWNLLPEIKSWAEKESSEHPSYDIGGRKGQSFNGTAKTIGWEGDIPADLEGHLGVSLLHDSFAFCRHTIEDLNYPGNLLQSLRLFDRGYIETPSPLAELTVGIDAGINISHRGYCHHRWIVGVHANILILVPKYPIIEHMGFPRIDESQHLLLDKRYWNTHYAWSPERPLRFKIYRHGKELFANDIDHYRDLIYGLAKVTADDSEHFWKANGIVPASDVAVDTTATNCL